MAVKTVLIDAAGEADGLYVVECWVASIGAGPALKCGSAGVAVDVVAGQRIASDAAYDYHDDSTATLGLIVKA